MKSKYIYMKVSEDKYQLPEFVADNPTELARMSGKSINTIYSAISHAEKNGGESVYVRVRKEE